MVVWIDSDKGDFGLDAATGYTASEASKKQYSLPDDVHFDPGEKQRKYQGRACHICPVRPGWKS